MPSPTLLKVKVGDLIHFKAEEPWDNMGTVNGEVMWPFIPVWTERKNGLEATTLMVHVNNVTAVNRETIK